MQYLHDSAAAPVAMFISLCGCGQVPISFPRLDHLIVLDLACNDITDITGVGNAPNLLALRLEYNALSSVSKIIRCVTRSCLFR